MHAPCSAPATELGEVTATLLTRLRQRAPLVHSITNGVVQGFTANVLLALGAAPAMVDIAGEAGAFASAADGLLINLGTPATEQRDAMREAVAGATASGTPWVLDPVAIGSLPIRTALARDLVRQRPTAVRGNASEVLALAGLGAGGRGTDAADAGGAALPAAAAIAKEHGSVVAISGQEDLIHAAGRTVRVLGGDPLLTRVTGGGCALGAVVTAFLAVRDDGSEAAAVAAAHAVYGLAASAAAASSAGPGSFAVYLLDELARLTPERVRAEARFEEWHAESEPSASPIVAALEAPARQRQCERQRQHQHQHQGPDLDLYLVTDAALCGDRGVAETVRLAVAGGVTFVQLRDKRGSTAEQLRELELLAAGIDGRAHLVVNDRLDVAVAARERGLPVAGVHLGQGDDAVTRARGELGEGAIVGLTANTEAHLEAVARMRPGTVDYLGVGAIRPTSTKPDHPRPIGIAGFRAFAAAAGLPCVAIGGVRLADVAALRRAGAAGVAMVSALCAAPNPEAVARMIRSEWQEAAR